MGLGTLGGLDIGVDLSAGHLGGLDADLGLLGLTAGLLHAEADLHVLGDAALLLHLDTDLLGARLWLLAHLLVCCVTLLLLHRLTRGGRGGCWVLGSSVGGVGGEHSEHGGVVTRGRGQQRHEDKGGQPDSEVN